MDTTDGLRRLSCTAVVMASRKPWSVFGAKYTAILACAAMAPTTSMSSSTSPSALLGSPTGWLLAPSTEPAVTLGAGLIFSALKEALRSEALYPPPSSMMATVCPDPLPAVGKLRSEEHTSELQSLRHLVCRLLLEKKK